MNRAPLAACAAALLAVVPLPLAAQERGGPPAGATIRGLEPIGIAQPVDAADCVITPFWPKAFDLAALPEIAGQLFGAHIEVIERNAQGDALNSWSTDHFMVFGETFFVRDSRARGQRILESLAQIDQQEADRRAAQEAREEQQSEVASRGDDDPIVGVRAAFQRAEVRPRHVPLATVYRALTRFERSLYRESTPQGEVERSNLTPVEEANLVLVEDVPSRVAEIVDLARRIDQPSPQVHVSALIVETTAGSETADAALPKELTAALSKMALGTSFRLLSTGALRCALQSQRFCSVGTGGGDGSSWNLSFVPESYDAEGRTVALSQCKFSLTRSASNEGRNSFGGPGSSQTFETNLTIALGEWVVLGAVGARPVLVALRVEAASPAPAAAGGQGK